MHHCLMLGQAWTVPCMSVYGVTAKARRLQRPNPEKRQEVPWKKVDFKPERRSLRSLLAW